MPVALQGGLGHPAGLAGHAGCVVLQTGEGVNDVRKGACANHVSTMAGFLKVRAPPPGPRRVGWAPGSRARVSGSHILMPRLDSAACPEAALLLLRV